MAGSRPVLSPHCWPAKASRASSPARCCVRSRRHSRLQIDWGCRFTPTNEGWSEADRNLNRYRSTETLRAQGDSEWQRFLLDPVTYLGDDPLRFRAAVLGALESTIAEGHREAVVTVFAHGLPINVVLSHAPGLEQITHFKVGYGSITRLRVLDARKIGVVSINESGHHAWPEQVAA